jgi:hypothetical protein
MKITLVNEVRTAVEHMAKSSSAQEKMYYFSAVFGIANRIMNLEFDPELAFLHHVTNAACNMINMNLAIMAQGGVATLPPNVFDKLQDALNELATDIKDGKSTYRVLERISNLAYSTSGNGYYLFLQGKLKIT